MRAAILRDGRLRVGEAPDPVPGPGQLLVRTLSTAICASDVHFMHHPETIDGDPRYLYDPYRDIVMGYEFVGEVVGHGPGCTGELADGTRVTSLPVLLQPESNWVIGQHPGAPGSFGELFLLSEKLARPVPDGVPDDAVRWSTRSRSVSSTCASPSWPRVRSRSCSTAPNREVASFVRV
jgi:threonine dehydrogenase-like Zn-dependent dehydrogenase